LLKEKEREISKNKKSAAEYEEMKPKIEESRKRLNSIIERIENLK